MAAPARAPTRDPDRPSRAQQRASRPRVVAGGAAPGIRWDRVGRVALLLVLLVVAGLYIGPATSYVSTMREASVRRGEVTELRAQNKALRERRAALRRPGTLEREARSLGMVRPGEKAWSVSGLPDG